MLLFCTDDDLQRLSQCDTILMDGTFKSCPKLYSQLYTIHGIVGNCTSVPFVYALLPSKTRTTYYDMLSVIRKEMARLAVTFNPTDIVTDFESAAIESAKQHFPNARLIGCFFHYCQSIWRKIQDLGLTFRYKADKDFRQHVQTHMALAFIPVDDIANILGELHQNYETDLSVVNFHNYFIHTWVECLFPPSLWNQYGNQSHKRTNNAVESWHARLNRQVRVAHPNIYVFINHIKREQCHASTLYAHISVDNYKTNCRTKYEKISNIFTFFQYEAFFPLFVFLFDFCSVL